MQTNLINTKYAWGNNVPSAKMHMKSLELGFKVQVRNNNVLQGMTKLSHTFELI
jgi:hypothetical protein